VSWGALVALARGVEQLLVSARTPTSGVAAPAFDQPPHNILDLPPQFVPVQTLNVGREDVRLDATTG
jgi:hypothetical protein